MVGWVEGYRTVFVLYDVEGCTHANWHRCGKRIGIGGRIGTARRCVPLHPKPGQIPVTTTVRSYAIAVLLAAATHASASPAQAQFERAPTEPSRAALIVLNKSDAQASIVDIASGKIVKTYPTGDGPHEVAVSPDGRTAVVGNYGAQVPGNSLTVIDLSGREASRAITLGEYRRPHGIVWLKDGRRVLVSNAAAGAISVYDAATRSLIASIEIPFDPSRKRAEAVLGDMGNSAVPLGILMEPNGQRAWVATAALGEVVEIDLATLSVRRTIHAGNNPDGMAYIARLP